MARLDDVIGYIKCRYVNALELSASRLVKILYLVDWRSAIVRGAQVTDLDWEIDESGPYFLASRAEVSGESLWPTFNRGSLLPAAKVCINTRLFSEHGSLNEEEKDIIDFVLNTASSKHFSEFAQLVYSTYPVQKASPRTSLDLVGLAREYSVHSDTRELQ